AGKAVVCVAGGDQAAGVRDRDQSTRGCPGIVPALPGARLPRGVGILRCPDPYEVQPPAIATMTGTLIATEGLSYLVGAIPNSFIVVRLARGIDLRTVGSGNLGAANLYRQLGWRYAVPVAVFDMLKGAFPVAVVAPWVGLGLVGSVALGMVAVLGH